MSLVDLIVKQTGVSEEQASGGAGLLMKLARERLDKGDFSKVVASLPEVSGLADRAPEAEGAGAMLGKIGGTLGGKAEDLGAMAGLAGAVSKLNLDKETLARFLPIILNWLKEKGGDEVQGIMAKALSGIL